MSASQQTPPLSPEDGEILGLWDQIRAAFGLAVGRGTPQPQRTADGLDSAGNGMAWAPSSWRQGNYTWDQAARLAYPDLSPDRPEPPPWLSKGFNREVGQFQTLHVVALQRIRPGAARRLFAVYGVPVGWGSHDHPRGEYRARFQMIASRRQGEVDWEAYLRLRWGLLNEEHHDFIHELLFPTGHAAAD